MTAQAPYESPVTDAMVEAALDEYETPSESGPWRSIKRERMRDALTAALASGEAQEAQDAKVCETCDGTKWLAFEGYGATHHRECPDCTKRPDEHWPQTVVVASGDMCFTADWNGEHFVTRSPIQLATPADDAGKDADDVLRKVIRWAESRCPCHEETPDPCTLCGATVESGTCKAVESVFPRKLLAELRAALQSTDRQEGNGNG